MKTPIKLAVAAAVLCGVTAQAAQAETLVVVSWGGAYSESQLKAYAEPFMAMHPDVEIIFEDKAQNGLAGLRAQHQANNVTWDVVDMLPSEAILACDEGLAKELDYSSFPAAPDGTSASDDFVKDSLTGCFVPEIVYSNVIACNSDMFDEGKMPRSIADVWATAKGGQKISLQKRPVNNLEWALVADGVAADEVYATLSEDAGVERAFNKLAEIKDNVVWWEEGAQPPQLLADKEVACASGYNGRFFNAQVSENQPFEIIWDGQVFELDGWVVAEGTSKPDLAMEFVKFSTDTQRLADQAKYISYGPARTSSGPLVTTHEATGTNMQPHMPTFAENFQNPVKKDDAWWADYGDEMAERFNAWLQS